jgi:hypothetical protein
MEIVINFDWSKDIRIIIVIIRLYYKSDLSNPRTALV